HGAGEVVYRVSQSVIWRRTDERSTWAEVLDRVKSSRMQIEPRQKITAWRWELALKTREPRRRIQPLLTFEPVRLQPPQPNENPLFPIRPWPPREGARSGGHHRAGADRRAYDFGGEQCESAASTSAGIAFGGAQTIAAPGGCCQANEWVNAGPC